MPLADQWASQGGQNNPKPLSPWAPAFAQQRASSLILSTSKSTEGVALSKTHAFLCFQIIMERAR